MSASLVNPDIGISNHADVKTFIAIRTIVDISMPCLASKKAYRRW
ncbi:hypothetical protein CCHR01_17035 [Colletotrichum chrysophilum]|uniref:Uncharacterized protein n=1 Tax=Colletotrichum chrysophilum TaxID=1836956 RepID=A0AAD9E9X5_9PEZI|nr:hypothetical protein CCHR01_17035 [Colletotrichum chrysophilum]